MVTHNNIHIPKESFPYWIWFVIEFAIVMAVSLLVSRQIMGSFQEYEETMRNWIFWGLVGSFFLGWYVIIRTFILKKKILENRW